MSTLLHGTTILAVRRDGRLAVGGDGQVTLGASVMKADARKVRTLRGGQVLVGFAGAVSDSFALLERFEQKLEQHQGNLVRAASELSRDWRTDRILRRLESMLVVGDRKDLLLLAGSGEVIQPSDGVVGIGSGGQLARAAALALTTETSLEAAVVVDRALRIAADICIYTNLHLHVEELR